MQSVTTEMILIKIIDQSQCIFEKIPLYVGYSLEKKYIKLYKKKCLEVIKNN